MFKWAGVQSYVPTEREYVYVLELAKENDALVPISVEDMNKASGLEVEQSLLLKKMDTSVDPSCLIEVGDRIEQLRELLKVLESKKKDTFQKLRKVKNTRHKSKQACSYWRSKDARKYAEWRIVLNAAEKVLDRYNQLAKEDAANAEHESMSGPIADMDSEMENLGTANQDIIVPDEDDARANDTDPVEDGLVLVTVGDGNKAPLNDIFPPAKRATKVVRTKRYAGSKKLVNSREI